MDRISVRPFKFYTALVVFNIAIQLICNSIEGKIVVFFHGFLPVSALIYPITFAVADVITDRYGFKYAVQAVYLNIFAQFLFCTLIPIAIYLPSPSFWHLDHSYKTVFNILIREDIGSIVSLIVAKIFNDYVVSKLKNILHGKRFWLRSIIGSSSGELLLVLIDYLITFFGKYNYFKIIEMITLSWALKCVFAILYAYPATKLSRFIKEIEGFDPYTENHAKYLFLGFGDWLRKWRALHAQKHKTICKVVNL